MYGEVTNIQTGTGGLRSEAIFSVHDNPCRALLYWPLKLQPCAQQRGVAVCLLPAAPGVGPYPNSTSATTSNHPDFERPPPDPGDYPQRRARRTL